MICAPGAVESPPFWAARGLAPNKAEKSVPAINATAIILPPWAWVCLKRLRVFIIGPSPLAGLAGMSTVCWASKLF